MEDRFFGLAADGPKSRVPNLYPWQGSEEQRRPVGSLKGWKLIRVNLGWTEHLQLFVPRDARAPNCPSRRAFAPTWALAEYEICFSHLG